MLFVSYSVHIIIIIIKKQTREEIKIGAFFTAHRARKSLAVKMGVTCIPGKESPVRSYYFENIYYSDSAFLIGFHCPFLFIFICP